MRVLGVDACRSGWVGVELVDSRFAGARLAPDLAALLDAATGVRVVGVDIPLGLVGTGWRDADTAAAAVLGRRPGLLYEVHPEVSFRHLGGAPMAYAKTTWNGQAARRTALVAHGIEVPDGIGVAGKAAPDDVLDAAVAAWSAHRIATGRAVSYPDPPQRSASGQEIAIWA